MTLTEQLQESPNMGDQKSLSCPNPGFDQNL